MAGIRADVVDSLQIRLEGLPGLVALMREWDAKIRREFKKLLTTYGNRIVKEAKMRVPVATGFLRNSINKEVKIGKDFFELAVGTNVRYGVYLEFGTTHIAGGRVKALGTGPVITDAEAITTWPAKDADRSTKHLKRRLKAIAKRGGKDEQMPWLRPSVQFVMPDLLRAMDEACEPPRGQAL